MRQSEFAHRFRSQALRTYIWREGRARRPFIRVMRHINGFFWIGIGPLSAWVDGRRIGWGRR